ncbi:procathepsin L-like isoform X2 [Dreissena polymorpha]|uniref:procathepsin L-like isoform X2 n=1 Tax=Dreissena polymorpha TaxID=45954 RepID=UPI0022655387|nr:procathepsin L-like isoform X2 [Dreissena polymorpha]
MVLLKSMVVFAAWLTFAAGSAEFSDFMTKYGKVYRDATEHYKRMSIWQSNLAMIERHNVQARKGHHSYTMGMNQFGDMTEEEVRSTMFGYRQRQQSRQLSTSNFHSNLTALPASVDWKAKGYVTAVGNQAESDVPVGLHRHIP